jgi:hypothetical protein
MAFERESRAMTGGNHHTAAMLRSRLHKQEACRTFTDPRHPEPPSGVLASPQRLTAGECVDVWLLLAAEFTLRLHERLWSFRCRRRLSNKLEQAARSRRSSASVDGRAEAVERNLGQTARSRGD